MSDNPYEPPLIQTTEPESGHSRIPHLIALSVFLSFVALGCCGNGPFITLFGELLPTISAVIAIGVGLSAFRKSSLPGRLVLLASFLASAKAIANVIVSVHRFWWVMP